MSSKLPLHHLREPLPCDASESPLILIVEDHDTLRSLLVTVLEDVGYRTLTAATVAEAVATVEHYGLDVMSLVITDMYLSTDTFGYPEGYTLYEQWHLVRPALPVLFISGSKEATYLPAVRSGVVPLLMKPFTMEAVIARVEALLSHVHMP